MIKQETEQNLLQSLLLFTSLIINLREHIVHLNCLIHFLVCLMSIFEKKLLTIRNTVTGL